jgi:hypothetical protein
MALVELLGEKFITRFLQFGFAAIIAGVLLGVFIGDVRAEQKITRTEHQGMREAIAAVVNVAGQSDMAQQQILHVLTTMCVNEAKTAEARERCVSRVGPSR